MSMRTITQFLVLVVVMEIGDNEKTFSNKKIFKVIQKVSSFSKLYRFKVF